MGSEFPSGIDRVATSYKQERYNPVSKPDDRSTAKLRAANKQMGEMMAKCISMLENEIFAPLASSIQSSDADPAIEEETQLSSNLSSKTQDDKNPDQENDIVEYEGSESSVVLDEEENIKPTEESEVDNKPPVQNEATMIMALAGLKHVRDVLLGKQQFDSSVIDMRTDGRTSAESEEWKWDLVDHKEAALNTPIPSNDVQPSKPSIFIPQTSSSLISNDMDSHYQQDKPLPPIIDQGQVNSPAMIIENKLPPVPTTYIPANPTPPKQQIKYRIEDLLSDPELQLPSPKATTNSKFKWMLSNEKENDDALSHHSSSSDLFKSEQAPRMSPRKRSSFIINRTTTVIDQTSETPIDPLDAKNVDNRRSYEFDML